MALIRIIRTVLSLLVALLVIIIVIDNANSRQILAVPQSQDRIFQQMIKINTSNYSYQIHFVN